MGIESGNNFSKEMSIRKKMASIFNKREQHFPSLREYNDYLEEVEDMTFDLIEGINEAEINAKIERYAKENAEQIVSTQAQKAEEQAAAALNARKVRPMQIDSTDQGAGQTSQIAGAGVSVQGQYAPAVQRPTQPIPLRDRSHRSDLVQGYGEMACEEDEESMKLKAERAAGAGGWTIQISRKRALEEAFSSIWI